MSAALIVQTRPQGRLMAWLTRWSRARLRRDIELSEVYVLQLEREMEKHRHRAQALRVRLARMEP